MKKDDKKEKKIRKLLLINSDQEMQKKIKKKNYVLINSMTPLQLENLFQLYKDRINTSVSTYTNVLEKHIIKHVVDTHKNIDYYYSDFIENKKGRIAHHRYNRYRGVLSAKNFDTNFRYIIGGDEESEVNEENEKEEEKEEEILKSIVPFIKKKKNVGAGKLVKDNTYSLISPGYYYKNSINLCSDTCDCNSNNQHCERQKNRKKMLDMNHKLIYYCYTNLKRKRPLIIQNINDNNVTIYGLYGLEIEEEQMNMRIKKNKIPIKLKKDNNKLMPTSSKNVNGSSMKKRKKNKNVKYNHKKNTRECATSKNGNNNNNHLNNFSNLLNNLKSRLERYISLRSDKKGKIRKKRLSQDLKADKLKANPSIKRHKKTNSTNNKITNKGESPFQNIVKKLDTNSSFDENSSSFENKNKIKNSIKKESDLNIKNKEEVKNLKKDNLGRRKFKEITDIKLKHKCFEELKIRFSYKPSKKSLGEPIRPQFRNSLKNKVGFIFEENKKNFYNKKALSKLSSVKKLKSKSTKDCTDYAN